MKLVHQPTLSPQPPAAPWKLTHPPSSTLHSPGLEPLRTAFPLLLLRLSSPSPLPRSSPSRKPCRPSHRNRLTREALLHTAQAVRVKVGDRRGEAKEREGTDGARGRTRTAAARPREVSQSWCGCSSKTERGPRLRLPSRRPEDEEQSTVLRCEASGAVLGGKRMLLSAQRRSTDSQTAESRRTKPSRKEKRQRTTLSQGHSLR